MGVARIKQQELKKASLPCIFCGGHVLATTKEHCPPRALFRERSWPEGYEFPACLSCNGGSSDSDLIVAFLAHMDPTANKERLAKGFNLMRLANIQAPKMLPAMFISSAVEARSQARRLGMRPGPGQTYQGLGIANVTDEMREAVESFAAKLTKAVFHMQTGSIFPTDGGIWFQWFTNAQLREHGKIPIIEAMANFAATSPTLKRNGKDLRDQFDYKYSIDGMGALHVLQVAFGPVFGFVTIFSQVPGKLEEMEANMMEQVPGGGNPFKSIGAGLDA
jgi:hypothetical protein